MDIAVVGGTGAEGFGLTLRLAAAGHHVTIGSRDATRGADAAARAVETLGRGEIDGTSNEESVAGKDLVVVTVPFAGQADIYRPLKGKIAEGTVVLDATSPLATAVGGKAWQVVRPLARQRRRAGGRDPRSRPAHGRGVPHDRGQGAHRPRRADRVRRDGVRRRR
jgi:NADPH-dependent F420 reductase